ncbi:PE-PGRS family protein [Streptomyces pseudovenezuelae]|uniref:PE-PGRS family protein n=1 Tax=Streptomyces pseudovenezuelae TaxID=67350 RepID=A0ABT6LB79_9ACTN|nr:PE-PGRS family protein [Streptomyces pseudovenezuelae]MDH6213556.1 hypothetical protein [Streptomyces pseudovenezuelae]
MTTRRDELTELLRRAGLEGTGDRRAEEVLPPWVAWRPVVALETEPTVTVQGSAADEVNAQWHRLAAERGILAGDGVFLIDVAGDWTGRRREWTRVRLGAEWDLAGVLGQEFVTASVDGGAVVGVTSEEGAVWLVVVDRIRERREEAARVAVRETPEERAAAWAALMRGPGPGEPLRGPWADGIVVNFATPDDVSVGLLGQSRYVLFRPLPPEVADAAFAHPDWHVRSMAAEMQRDVTPEQWARLILGEQDARRRRGLVMIAVDRRAELPEDVVRQLAADPVALVRAEVAQLPGPPVDLAIELTRDPEPAVRAAACRVAWPRLDLPGREGLLADPEREVRRSARSEHHREHPVTLAVFETGDLDHKLLGSRPLAPDLAEHLARQEDATIRRTLAHHAQLPPDLVAFLAEDPDPGVRFAVSTRADLSEEQRAGIRIEFEPGTHYGDLKWVRALHDDADAMRRLALSAHPLVRRSVARARHLPPDVVELLARDEDRVVRLFLAESCDDAPADMLLEVWQWWTGSLSCPDRPHGHPNFPRTDLLRYADDPNPRLRQLALDDPESTPELVERLSRDPSAEVRRRAVADPRLTAVSAVRLLDDPDDSVRHEAISHPHLPAHVLTGLLRDPDTARAAAEHPALPVEVLRWMSERLHEEVPSVTA